MKATNDDSRQAVVIQPYEILLYGSNLASPILNRCISAIVICRFHLDLQKKSVYQLCVDKTNETRRNKAYIVGVMGHTTLLCIMPLP